MQHFANLKVNISQRFSLCGTFHGRGTSDSGLLWLPAWIIYKQTHTMLCHMIEPVQHWPFSGRYASSTHVQTKIQTAAEFIFFLSLSHLRNESTLLTTTQSIWNAFFKFVKKMTHSLSRGSFLGSNNNSQYCESNSIDRFFNWWNTFAEDRRECHLGLGHGSVVDLG